MSGYIGTQPVPQATQTRDAFTATNNQTSFPTSGYTPEFLDVFLNGVKLAAADYTATNGSDVVLAAGATTGDILEVVSYGTFEVLNPTFDGNVTFTGNASFGDNDKAIFGDGSDLEIYHSGGSSQIRDVGTGNLQVSANAAIEFFKTGTSEVLAKFNADSDVELYHDNAIKLSTTSTGVDVTGTVTADDIVLSDANAPSITLTDTTNTVTTLIQSGNSSSTIGTTTSHALNFVTNNVDRMLIDSSGNVGIGTDSPSNYNSAMNNLVIADSGDSGITVVSGTSSEGSIAFADGTSGQDAYRGWINYNHGANFMRFSTNGSQRMRIDASGNLLVGKTTGAFATAGTKIAPAGQVEITAASDGSLALNRTGSYGYIQRFYKDSVISGYIGSYSGSGGNQFYISGADTGFKFNSVVDIIGPSNANGDTRDNAISLGDSGGRFKDLYLAGGVYLGGTGSANKLDDYEEGNWTPIISGSSNAGTMNYNSRFGRYTKVGRLVTLHFYIEANQGTGSGNLLLGGPPFTIANYHFAFGSPQWNSGISYPSGGVDANWLRYNSTSFDIRCNRNSSSFVTVAYSSSVEYLRGCITYETDA